MHTEAKLDNEACVQSRFKEVSAMIGYVIVIGILAVLLFAFMMAGFGVEKDMRKFEAQVRTYEALFRGADVKRVNINTDGFQEVFEIRRVTRGAA
jgi:hypothetical protein